MVISLIAAMSENRVIGVQNRLPWNLPADLANFKRITAGKKFIMGRKSYEAEDKLFSDTGNVIITRQKNYPVAANDTTAPGLREAIEKLQKETEVFILGGAEIFTQSIDIADKLYITLVHSKFIGDAFFPEIDLTIWKISKQSNFSADEENSCDYSFIEYIRR
jgi:dihydrofolate reductase